MSASTWKKIYRDSVKKYILQSKKQEKTNQCFNTIEHANDNKKKEIKIFLFFVNGGTWYFQFKSEINLTTYFMFIESHDLYRMAFSCIRVSFLLSLCLDVPNLQ